MSITTQYEPRRLIRVVACVAPPFCPGEVHELAAADVVVDSDGVRLEALRRKVFAMADETSGCGGTGCTPLHVAECVWGGRPPDVLVAHDASTASLVFKGPLTGQVPWISLHKLARRVWPGQHCYALESLTRWRAWPGPHGPFTSILPCGAERDAELTAGLLAELLRDPGLIDVAETTLLDRFEWEGSDLGGGASLGGWSPLEAALAVSALPSKPLRQAPFPFDDQGEWGGIGLEDLRYFAHYSDDQLIAEAALAALQSRPRTE